ncbi:MAG: hypothetical protein JSV16_04805, partial [Candidatus Hydrogenedentota bacterium]
MLEQSRDIRFYGVAGVDDHSVFKRELFTLRQIQFVALKPEHRRRGEEALIACEPFAREPAILRVLQNSN